MSGPIFGSSAGATGSSGGNRHLVEFCAGRLNMVGKMVTPDNRKGLVYLYQADDGLIHFCWKDRTSGKVEDDLIIFPDDCEFLRIEQCKTGRVYVLKFQSSSRRLFFWLQEAKTDKDAEWCRRVNDIMNNPPTMGSGRGGGGGGGGGGSGTESSDLQYMLNNMSQQQLMQLFGGVGPMRGLGSLLGSMNSSRSNRNSSNSLNLGPATPAPAASAAATTTTAAATPASASSSSTTTATSSTATTIGTPSTPTNQSITTVTPQAPRHSQRLSTGAATAAAGTGAAAAASAAAAATAASAGPEAGASGTKSGPTVQDLATAVAAATAKAARGNSASATGSANDKNLLTELQSYLHGLQTDGATGSGAGGSAAPKEVAFNDVDLAAALNAEHVTNLIGTDATRAAQLAAHLPDIQSTDSPKKQLKDTVSSPQFRQALSTFSTALQSGQLGPVVSQFQLDLDAVAAANQGDLEQFVRALEKKPAAEAGAAADDKQKKSGGGGGEAEPMEEDKPSDA